MAKIRSYTCSKCGGALMVDSDQKVFDCPFCGAAFDFEYFHRKDIGNEAGRNLRMLEFHSAKEKYEYILATAPTDFEALRGLVLCAGKIGALGRINTVQKLIACDYQNAGKVLSDVTERAAEKDKAYFSCMADLISLAGEYNDCDELDKKLGRRVSGEKKNIAQIDENKEAASTRVRDAVEALDPDKSITSVKYSIWTIVFILFWFVLFACYLIWGIWGALIFLGIFILLFVIRAVYLHSYETEKESHMERISKIGQQRSSNRKKMAEIEKEYVEKFQMLQDLDPENNKDQTESSIT